MLQGYTPADLTAAALLHGGGVLAYPTEAVFGLGRELADQVAFDRLFAL
ncbi:MAG: hypothetical protein ABI114_16635 [Rhodanobacter sp.]